MSNSQNFVVVAGAAGELGSLIALDIIKRKSTVKGLVRPGTAASRTQALRDAGVIIIEIDLTDVPALTEAFQGATTIVSALQGLGDVLLGVQGKLLEAALAAKVPRFIPSDYTMEIPNLRPDANRNLGLRGEFHQVLDQSGIAWTSILNGAFMEMLIVGQLSLFNHGWRRITHFGSADQKFNFTTYDDTARYTAAVALDPRPTPKFLRISGDTVAPQDLADIATRVKGQQYTTMKIGSVGLLRGIIWVLKSIIGGEKTKLIPLWQALQYMENMVSGTGRLAEPLDNDRYPEVTFTTVEEALREQDAKKTK